MQALGAALELARRLRDRAAASRSARACSAASIRSAWSTRWRYFAAREPWPEAKRIQSRRAQARDRAADRLLVVVDDRVAVGGLVARQAQRVERQRVPVGRRALLLQQAADDAKLDGIRIHAVPS